MFKLVQTPEFTHDVPVMVPVDGGHEEQSLRVRFRVVGDLAETENPAELMKRAVVSVDNLVDDEEKPIAWNDEVRDRLLALPYVRLAMMRAYGAALTKARQGN